MLPFASIDNIIMVGPIFRKNILKNLKPEDKDRLSEEQLANLMKGIKEE